MKTKIFATAIAILLANSSFAQQLATDSVIKKEISKLEFMVGSWEGEGWMMGRDGQKMEFVQTEEIQFKLDTTTLLIEGLGKHNEVVTHNALAIISFNKEVGDYSFLSYLQNGQKGEFKAELIENKLYWYPNENSRYIIWINSNGQWVETGEFNREDKWFQFFEMTLDRAE